MNALKAIFPFVALSFFASCEDKKEVVNEGPQNQGNIIAQVGEKTLFENELNDLDFSDLSKEDSIARLENFVKNWARNQLILELAEKDEQINTKAIDRRVKNLREQLIMYEFKKNLIERKLDTLVSRQEIEQYYFSHQDDFELKQNIFKGAFIKLDIHHPNKQSLINAFYSNQPDALEKVLNWSQKNANEYIVSDSNWIYFNEAVTGTPYADVPNQTRFITNHKYSQRQDETQLYLIRIEEYKIIDDIAPLQLHLDQITRIIINKRKQRLLSDFENKLYSSAIKSKRIEYY